MIRLLPLGSFCISDNTTPEDIRQSLKTSFGINFTSKIQETQTGRFLPDDEALIDDREYYISFNYDPPPVEIFNEPIVHPDKYERIE